MDVDPEQRVAVATVAGLTPPPTHRLVAVDLDARTILHSWDITFWGEPEASEIAAVPGAGWVAVAVGAGNHTGVRLFDWRTGDVVEEQTGLAGRAWIDVAPAYGLGIGVDRPLNQFVGYCLER